MTSDKNSAKDKQSNIGYENTKTRNDGDEKETARVSTSEPGTDNSPTDDDAGLRSESGSKTQGQESGDHE